MKFSNTTYPGRTALLCAGAVALWSLVGCGDDDGGEPAGDTVGAVATEEAATPEGNTSTGATVVDGEIPVSNVGNAAAGAPYNPSDD